MPLLALVCDPENAGAANLAAARAFLAGLEGPRVLASPTPAAGQAAAALAPELSVEVVDGLADPRPDESPAAVAARVMRTLPAAGAAVAVAGPALVAALAAETLAVQARRAGELRPDPGGITVLRHTGAEPSLMLHNVLPADPLHRASPAAGRRLYLLRHAETDTVTPDGRLFSQAPLPLTIRGREQADALALAFAAVPAAVVHSSPIARAEETARRLAGAHCPVHLHAGLREVPLGDLEGAHYSEIFAPETGFLAHPDAALPGGESFRAVGDRAAVALEAILAAETAPEVVVVAHGGVNRALLGRLLGIAPEDALRIRQDWAGVNVLEHEDGRWRARTLNWSPAGLEELEHARRAALLGEQPAVLGGHVMDWRTA